MWPKETRQVQIKAKSFKGKIKCMSRELIAHKPEVLGEPHLVYTPSGQNLCLFAKILCVH